MQPGGKPVADIMADAPGAAKQAFITSSTLTGPLQRYMLPQLTPDAVIVLRATCKTLHQLITTAPLSSLQRTLQTLLPPGFKHCAADSQAMRALLKTQRKLQWCLQAGAEAKLQMVSVPDLETPWEYCWDGASSPLWALESPCRRLVLECTSTESHDIDNDQVLMDPCDLLASLKPPAVRQLSRGDIPFLRFVNGGALVEAAPGLAILDMDTQEPTSTWQCPVTNSDLDCKAGLDSGLICVVASLVSNSRRWHTRGVAVLEQSSLQELLVIAPAVGPCQDALAASKPLAAVRCDWVQPSPDGQHIGLWWCDAADRSYSRLCIYSLLNTKLVADLDCHAAFGTSATDRYTAEWSPDSKHILFPTFQFGRGQHLMRGIMIAHVSGSYRMLATSLTSRKLESSWSADGRYIYIDRSDDAQPSPAQSAGSVWRVQTGEEVLSWEYPRSRCRAVWSPVGSSILLPDLTLVSLPVDGSPAEVSRQPYHRPECIQAGCKGSGFKFSPSGSTLVAAWQANANPPPAQLPQELWHADCPQDSSTLSAKPVAAEASGWLTSSIAWNPSPWVAHIYAIATGGGSLYLIDAQQHRPLRSWSRAQLVGSARQQDPDTFSLSWSPDGSQLLALGYSCISLLTFAPAVSNNASEDGD